LIFRKIRQTIAGRQVWVVVIKPIQVPSKSEKRRIKVMKKKEHSSGICGSQRLTTGSQFQWWGLILLTGISLGQTNLAAQPVGQGSPGAEKIRVLIIDGQNNHDAWPKTTAMMKQYLEETGLATVDVARTRYTWNGGRWMDQFPLNDGVEYQNLQEPRTDPDFQPAFESYDVVINNMGYGAAPLAEGTQKGLDLFVKNGGGLVAVHAANNCWPDWKEYNLMIGLGGWGGRTEKSGPYVYLNPQGEKVRDPSPGPGGSHGPQHDFLVINRAPQHPVMQGVPAGFMHGKDELYDRLRGPAENIEILATAFSAGKFAGTERHEPVIVAVQYGSGRVFHSTLGHADYSMESVAFIATFLRGVEWAATGKVTMDLPSDFPDSDGVSRRPFSDN
jgi:type 1 glutamine amidotransferase